MIYAMLGFLRAAVGRLAAWEYRDSHKGTRCRDGPANSLYGGFAFWPLPCPAGPGAKMPPAGRRTAHKRQKAGNVVGVQETGRPATGKPWRAVIELSENKIIRSKLQIPGQKRQI